MEFFYLSSVALLLLTVVILSSKVQSESLPPKNENEGKSKMSPKILGLSQEDILMDEIPRAELECNATGRPRPLIHWFRTTELLSTSFQSVSKDMWTVRTMGDESIVSKLVLGFSDIYVLEGGNEFHGFFNYICTAENEEGLSWKRISFHDKNQANRTDSFLKKYGFTIGLIVLTLLLVIVIGILVWTLLDNFRLKRQLKEIFEDEQILVEEEQVERSNVENISYNRIYEIPRRAFQYDKGQILGKGQFGIVYKGTYKGMTVAVKTLRRDRMDDHMFGLFLKEIRTFEKCALCPRVTTIMAAHCPMSRSAGRQAYLLLEFCANGSIESFIEKFKKNRNSFCDLLSTRNDLNGRNRVVSNLPSSNGQLSTLDLAKWSAQIAEGMKYITDRHILHKDLAARNVLLTGDLDVKISDFGLAKSLYGNNKTYISRDTKNYKPFKWMALESLVDHKFSKQTEVWAYGVTIWEIWTLMKDPYPRHPCIGTLVAHLKGGGRLEKPKFCSDQIYNIMRQCWSCPNPNEIGPQFQRPMFQELIEFFENQRKQLAASSDPNFVPETTAEQGTSSGSNECNLRNSTTSPILIQSGDHGGDNDGHNRDLVLHSSGEAVTSNHDNGSSARQRPSTYVPWSVIERRI